MKTSGILALLIAFQLLTAACVNAVTPTPTLAPRLRATNTPLPSATNTLRLTSTPFSSFTSMPSIPTRTPTATARSVFIATPTPVCNTREYLRQHAKLLLEFEKSEDEVPDVDMARDVEKLYWNLQYDDCTRSLHYETIQAIGYKIQAYDYFVRPEQTVSMDDEAVELIFKLEKYYRSKAAASFAQAALEYCRLMLSLEQPLAAATPTIRSALTITSTIVSRSASPTPRPTQCYTVSRAICRDGTSSSSSGRGTCSQHGGVSHYATNQVCY